MTSKPNGFGADLADFAPTMPQMIAEVERELAMRERVYPIQIKNKKMKPHQAHHHMTCMRAVLETLAEVQRLSLAQVGKLTPEGFVPLGFAAGDLALGAMVALDPATGLLRAAVPADTWGSLKGAAKEAIEKGDLIAIDTDKTGLINLTKRRAAPAKDEAGA